MITAAVLVSAGATASRLGAGWPDTARASRQVLPASSFGTLAFLRLVLEPRPCVSAPTARWGGRGGAGLFGAQGPRDLSLRRAGKDFIKMDIRTSVSPHPAA